MTKENLSLNDENQESGEKNTKQTNSIDFKAPMNEFIDEKIKNNILYFKNKKNDDLWKEFISFISRTNSDYDANVIKHFNDWKDSRYLSDLVYLVKKETISNNYLYNWVVKLFEKTYEFEDDQLNTLKEFLLKEKKWDLQYLMAWDIARRKYLKSKRITYKEDVEENDQFLEKIFKWVDKNSIELIKWNSDVMQTLKSFYESSYLVDVSDLEKILTVLWWNKKAKNSLIQYFVPKITLEEAMEYGFIDEEKAKEHIIQELKNTQDTISDDDINNFIGKSVDYNDFFIDTDNDLLSQNFEINDKSKKILQKAIIEYKKSNLESKTWVELDSIEQFIEQALAWWIIPESSKEAFRKFWKWAYFVKTKKDNEWKEEKQYYYVEDIFDTEWSWKKYFKIRNISDGNGWILKNDRSHINTETVSFEDLFLNISWVKDSSWTKKIDFYSSKEEFKNKTQVVETLSFTENLETWDIQTEEELKKILDEIDSDWSNIPLNKMAFRCKPIKKDETKTFPNEEEVYYVKKVENWQITLDGNPPMSFSDFALAFKKRACKRFTKIDNDTDFFDSLKSHEKLKEWLKDFEFDHGKIIPKWHHGPNHVEYLVADDWTAIKIKSLWHDFMSFETWTYTEKEDKDKNTITNTFKWDKKCEWYDYSTMYLYLTSKKFKPIYNKEVDEHDEHHDDEHWHWKHLHKHWSLLKSWLSCLSFNEMMAWVHHVTHTIEHKLKFWSDLRAAKFAKKLWKFFPDWILYEIESVVEQEEAKNMEAKIKELKGMNTPKMIAEIEHIVASSKPFDPELEAALFAIVSKTWVLYPKQLKGYRWSFMWYEALWWKVWDNIYNEFKKKIDEDPKTPFTEEALVEYLLEKQVSANLRRNKFDKQYWNMLAEWRDDELKDWEIKTKNKTTDKWRLDYIFSEFKSLTYWNWIWWIDNFLAKWPLDWHMAWSLPFVILTSWIADDLLPMMLDKLIAYAYTTPVFTSFSVLWNKKSSGLYKNYVERIIELKYWKDSKILKDFKNISKKSISTNIDNAIKFWEKYWKELFPIINMNDWFVVSEMNDKWNEVFEEYYNKIKWVHDSDSFKGWLKKEMVEEWFIDFNNGTWSAIAADWALIWKINISQTWTFDTLSKKIAIHHLDYMKWIINNTELDENSRKDIFKKHYKLLERQISSQVPKDKNYKSNRFYQDIIKYSDFFEIFPSEYELYQMNGSDDEKAYNDMLEEKWKEVKNWTKLKNEVDDEIKTVKSKVKSVLE